MRRNVLVVHGTVENHERASGVITAALDWEVSAADGVDISVVKGSLVGFHKRLGHLSYDAVERLAQDPISGIEITDHHRVNCLTCAQGKQSKNIQSKKDTSSNPGRASPLKILAKPTPSLGEIVGMVVGIGVETKGYRVYLPKDRNVVTTQRAKNGKKRSKKSKKKKKTWTRERLVTRSVGRTDAAEAASPVQQVEDTRDVVNNVVEVDPNNYGQAMRNAHKEGWLEAMAEELKALEANGVWEVVQKPRGVHILRTKWVYKTK
ncbi:hypothetical protein PC129_g9231 [Phytophthora cactorum]|uniref:GAG-pre-integrase domain-containing protein n=1 Tax=Phytophthora cactorum TaxID=29920 RepID=A0A8T1D0A5_9STRA|nr:hypothetical protein PC113_g11755 [Phytophthora cactorum]KAG2900595.1 hypothetical protein PC114_g13500 [Phytophthora cactorum]KAG2914007.1 hypothetical protein PC115_g11825 [Phytophthora cactorum]KAG2932400.1 hypothetical protein PC117_g13159 [Phytophthora cactorum]KAG3011707.1 hypothetical protein PC119_g13132 [Phytophthora cactorum]